jgi:flagellin
MINVNSNISALKMITAFNDSQDNLSKSLLRLSTGLRVNSAQDDPGGLGVSMRLNAQIARKSIVHDEVNNAVSFLDTQDAVMDAANSVLERMAELTQLGVGSLDTSAQAIYQVEYEQLEGELQGLLTEEFNGRNMFNDGGATLTVFISDNTSQTASITQANMEDQVYDVVSNGDVTTTATYSAVTTAINNLAELRATNGGEQNRFDRAASVLDAGIINLTAANSRIMDADTALESVNMTKYDILQQSSLAMLVQANQSNENILLLLR